MLDDLRAKGINTAFVTLHVGLGTFRPVKEDEVLKHKMHSEHYHLPKEKGVDKNSELVKMVKVWVDKQYEEGRVTVLTDNELVEEIGKCCKKLKIDTLER